MTSNEIDIAAVRADTPACAELIHFNNAGAALPPQPVLDATIDHLRLEAQVGGYEAHDAAAEQRRRTYEAGARLLNCAPEELAMTTGASEAWWRAFQSIPFEPGDRILADRAEYNSNAFALIQAQRHGIEVEVIGDDADGQVDLAALKEALTPAVRLVALTHIPTSGGLVNPAEAVGELAKENGSLYIIDACQSAGQRVLDVDELECDFLALTGRKFLRGPRGTGMLYVRSSVMDQLRDPTFIDSHSADWVAPDAYELRDDASRFELFESAIAAHIGLGVAIEYALDLGLDPIERRVTGLARRLRELLAGIPSVTVLDQGVEKCGIVVFEIDGCDHAGLIADLRAERINTSLATARTAFLDLGMRGVDTAVRASVHYYNTDDELDRFVEALDRLR